MQPVYRQYPEVKARHHMLLDPDLTQGFDVLSGNQSLGGGELSPSTGWYGERPELLASIFTLCWPVHTGLACCRHST